jgi:hypothetical protein
MTLDMLMADAFVIGIKPWEFWTMTPRELMACIQGWKKMNGIEDENEVVTEDDCSSYTEWYEKVWKPAYEKGLFDPKMNN